MLFLLPLGHYLRVVGAEVCCSYFLSVSSKAMSKDFLICQILISQVLGQMDDKCKTALAPGPQPKAGPVMKVGKSALHH